MRLETVDGITVTSVGGGVATIATRPGGGNTFTYVGYIPGKLPPIYTKNKAFMLKTVDFMLKTADNEGNIIKTVFSVCG